MEYFLGGSASMVLTVTMGISNGVGTIEYSEPETYDVAFYEREKYHVKSFAGMIQVSFIYRF
jgi:hypothetical protein